MGVDWLDIQGSFPCPQGPLPKTWARGCPPSELSMPYTSACRVGRYTGSPDTLVLDQLRGFSARSFAGLSTLQLLWKILNVVTNGKLGAIACPPQLIVTPPVAHTLHLLHYDMRQISYVCGSLVNANWISSRFAIRMLALRALPIKSTFGAREHNYSHWLTLNHAEGW